MTMEPTTRVENVSIVGRDVVTGLTGTLSLSQGRIELSNQSADVVWGVRLDEIVLHAVSTESATFPEPCVYCQLGEGSGDALGDGQDDDNDDAAAVQELRIVPANAADVQRIFDAMCAEAARLSGEANGVHPEEGDFVFDEEEVAAGARGGEPDRLEALERLAGLVVESADPVEGQFDDAEEEDEEEADQPAPDVRADANVNGQESDSDGDDPLYQSRTSGFDGQ